MHQGTCHCGAVAFEADVDPSGATHCNCTICTKTMWTGLMCKPAQFRLLRGEDNLGGYSWGGKISTRYFCKTCGVQCFGRGELEILGGAFVSINANTLDDVDPHALVLMHWDGRHDNWQSGSRAIPWPIR